MQDPYCAHHLSIPISYNDQPTVSPLSLDYFHISHFLDLLLSLPSYLSHSHDNRSNSTFVSNPCELKHQFPIGFLSISILPQIRQSISYTSLSTRFLLLLVVLPLSSSFAIPSYVQSSFANYEEISSFFLLFPLEFSSFPLPQEPSSTH